jgi:hypothetical protein
MAEIGIPQLVAIAVALVAGLVVAVLFLKPSTGELSLPALPV